MNTRFTIFAFVVSACFVFVGHANMYNDWAQQSAVNLNRQSASTDAATMIRDSSASTESEASQQCIARPAAYDLLNGINDVNCNNANLRDAIISADAPSTFQRMKDHLKENPIEFHVLPPEESLYHNMKENAPLRFPMSTLDSLILGVKLKSEYKTLLKSVRDGVPIRSEDFTYLDPSMPNVKYVSFDNHREVVYNRATGERIRTGINAGTANEASANRSAKHVRGDIPRYGRCRTPTAEQVVLGEELSRHPELVEWLAKNPDVLDDILKGDISDPKRVVRNLEDKMSRLQQKAKDTLLGNDAKDMIEPDLLRDEAKSAIDTVKRETRSTKSDSNDVSTANIANQKTVTVDNLRHGVRGWCDCGDDHGKRYIVGDMFCMYDKLECDLAYTLYGRCGCVVRPKDCAGEGLKIMDVKLYKELKQKNGGKLAWSDAFDSLKARQSKIESIPNGQIVVGGLCTCKFADPISVGFTNKIIGELYVCCNCGRVREPDENGDVPSGPTALSEMGLNEQAEKESERILNWLGEGKSLK